MDRIDDDLLLLSLLSRWFDEPGRTLHTSLFAHAAEPAVLEIVLAGQLEQQVTSVFSANYDELVSQARDRLAVRYAPLI